MRKNLLIFLLIIVCSLLSAQDLTMWYNIRNSAVTQNDSIVIRCEAGNNYLETQMYYLDTDGWVMSNMNNFNELSLQGKIYGSSAETNYVRFRTSSDTTIIMMPAYVPDESELPAVEYLGYVTSDPEGDSMVDNENLDITAEYFGYSENKFYTAMSNVTGEFPTDEGGYVPNEFYFYIGGILNPETIMQDSTMYGLVYADIPMALSPGLYKISGTEFNPENIEQIGEIEYEVIDGNLVMSCNMEDIVNDEDFGNWPNLSNSIAFQAITNKVTMSMDYFIADNGKGSFQNIDQYMIEPFSNYLPEISNLQCNTVANINNFSVDYYDANGHFPLTALIEVYNGQNLEEYNLTTINPDYTESVTFTKEFSGDWDRIEVLFSDNGYEFVTDTLYYSESEDNNIASVDYRLNNFPNPFNPNTVINYQIVNSGMVEIVIYNLKGQTVKTLVNENKNSGNYQVSWNGKDNHNNKVSSGIYLYELKLDSSTKAVNKMLLLE